MSPEVCRFLDAGNDEWLLALGRPASKKRQGTKSREVGHRLSSEHYGDLILTQAVMVGAMLAQRRTFPAHLAFAMAADSVA
jgi:hypothetical protein